MARNIAFFVGGEVGGLEEASAAGTGNSISSANASMLNKDNYHYRISGSFTALLGFAVFTEGRPSDQGNGYILSFDTEWTSFPDSDTETLHCYEGGGGSTAFLEMEISSAGVLSLKNANNTVISSSSALSLNTKYRVEIYFEHSASAAWEWWIDGTSIGSGTGADMTDGGTFTGFGWDSWSFSQTYDLNNIVLQSGCTKSDRLGAGVEVIAYASDGGTPTEGGSALDSGAMINTQEVPLTTDLAQFTSGPKSRWIQADGTHTVLGPGPSGDGLTNIIASKIVAQPAP